VEDLLIVFVAEVAGCFACGSTCAPVFPFLLLLLVVLVDLGILVGELQGFHFVLLALLYVLWVVWHYLQLLRHFELLRRVHFDFFYFLARVCHGS
jgi:hypothetical protein